MDQSILSGAEASTSTQDIIIVGGGVVGASLSTVLARDGRTVLCMERDMTEQQRIVGELLQPGGVRKLNELGLLDAVDGIDAQCVYGYGLFLDRKTMCIDYVDTKKQDASTVKAMAKVKQLEGPPAGRSFHNGRFVSRLREIASKEKNVKFVGANVLELEREGSGDDAKVIGVKYKANDDGKEYVAKATLTIGCDGCASRLRKQVIPAAEYNVFSQFVGLVLEDVQLPYPEHGHVILANPSPVLFYPISSNEVRCLVDIPHHVREQPNFSVRNYLEFTVLPQIPEILKQPFRKAMETEQFKSMPNRVMPANPGHLPGAILLGDSFNMRHPLTGGGMTVAFSDVVLVRDILKRIPDLSDQKALSKGVEEFYIQRKGHSSTINILANALYSVFCATDDVSLEVMRQACFDYLASGGRRSNDPISMLGGLNGSTTLLISHFFAVAVYGCGRALLPFPTPKRVAMAWSLFRSAFNIIKPLIDAEKVTFLRWIPFSRIGGLSL